MVDEKGQQKGSRAGERMIYDPLRRGFFTITTSADCTTYQPLLAPAVPRPVGESGLWPVRLVCAGRSFGGRAPVGGPAAFFSAGRSFVARGPFPRLFLRGVCSACRVRSALSPGCLAALVWLFRSCVRAAVSCLLGVAFAWLGGFGAIGTPAAAGLTPVTPRPFVWLSGGVCFVGAPGVSGGAAACLGVCRAGFARRFFVRLVAFGAFSCVILWRVSSRSVTISSHSGGTDMGAADKIASYGL